MKVPRRLVVAHNQLRLYQEYTGDAPEIEQALQSIEEYFDRVGVDHKCSVGVDRKCYNCGAYIGLPRYPGELCGKCGEVVTV